MTIKEIEKLITDMRIDYVRKVAETQHWNLENLDNADLIEIYACLKIKEESQKNLDKELKL